MKKNKCRNMSEAGSIDSVREGKGEKGKSRSELKSVPVTRQREKRRSRKEEGKVREPTEGVEPLRFRLRCRPCNCRESL